MKKLVTAMVLAVALLAPTPEAEAQSCTYKDLSRKCIPERDSNKLVKWGHPNNPEPWKAPVYYW